MLAKGAVAAARASKWAADLINKGETVSIKAMPSGMSRQPSSMTMDVDILNKIFGLGSNNKNLQLASNALDSKKLFGSVDSTARGLQNDSNSDSDSPSAMPTPKETTLSKGAERLGDAMDVAGSVVMRAHPLAGAAIKVAGKALNAVGESDFLKESPESRKPDQGQDDRLQNKKAPGVNPTAGAIPAAAMLSVASSYLLSKESDPNSPTSFQKAFEKTPLYSMMKKADLRPETMTSSKGVSDFIEELRKNLSQKDDLMEKDVAILKSMPKM